MRAQIPRAAVRPRGGGRWKCCSCRGGREQCHRDCATPILDHLEQLLREEQGAMGMEPPPAAPPMTRSAQGRPRPQGSFPGRELWGPTVSLCWCGDSRARCPQQGTSAPVCMTNKAPRISALPLLLLFSPRISGRGSSCPGPVCPLGPGTRLSPALGHHSCLLQERCWPWGQGQSGDSSSSSRWCLLFRRVLPARHGGLALCPEPPGRRSQDEPWSLCFPRFWSNSGTNRAWRSRETPV